MLAGAVDGQKISVARPALFRNVHAQSSGKILARDAFLDLGHLRRSSRRDNIAAVDARARPHVNQVVGGAQSLLVVLHDNHGVPQIAQTGQRVNQALVVALVKTDARLVKNVHDAGKRASNLGGQTNSLRLAAAQSARASVQRKVFQADVLQKIQARANFFYDLRGYLQFSRRKFYLVKKIDCFQNAQGAKVDDVLAADGDAQRLLAQALSFAQGTFAHRHELFFHADALAFAPSLRVAPLHVGHHAKPRALVFRPALAALLLVNPAQNFFLVAVHQKVKLLGGQLFKRSVQSKVRRLRDGAEHRARPLAVGIVKWQAALVERL